MSAAIQEHDPNGKDSALLRYFSEMLKTIDAGIEEDTFVHRLSDLCYIIVRVLDHSATQSLARREHQQIQSPPDSLTQFGILGMGQVDHIQSTAQQLAAPPPTYFDNHVATSDHDIGIPNPDSSRLENWQDSSGFLTPMPFVRSAARDDDPKDFALLQPDLELNTLDLFHEFNQFHFPNEQANISRCMW